ncbi:MAG: M20 family peptidase [Myxococcota bacterium]
MLLGVLSVRAAMLQPEPTSGEPFALPSVDADAVAQRMSAVVRHATITVLGTTGEPQPGADRASFERLRRTLADAYPRAHQVLKLEILEDSLLYTWPGSEPDAAPVLFAAHTDVVPVEPGTEDDWTHPPFSGAIADGYVWGRGSIDDKLGVVGVMEAVEALAARGYAPRRTVIVAFGHDEETGGDAGASMLAQTLAARGVKPWFAFDEGGAVITDMLPGISKPVALVGVGEKGYATLELVVEGEGGHSNMPPAQSTIGRLGVALHRLESDKFPTDIRGGTSLMVDAIAPHTPFAWRLALANRWLFDPLIAAALGTQQASNASVRTTTAVTRFDAGVADNVVASRARAVVNFRLLPGDSVDDVIAHVRDVIDDEGIAVRCAGECREATVQSRTDGAAFGLIERTLRSVYPDAVVAPYLVIGGTDARYYQPITEEGAFRFLPVRLTPRDRARMHGTDERIAVEDLRAGVQFYTLLMEHASK